MSGWCADSCQYVILILVALFSWIAPVVEGFAYEFTFIVEPGQQECFYQPISKTGSVLEIDYQVIEGSGMDITFILRDPKRHDIRHDAQQRMGSHQIMAREAGDYELCFDNRFSHMTAKMVFFEIYTDFDDDSFTSAMQQAQKSAVQESAEMLMEMTVDEIKTILTSVQRNTEKTKTIQSLVASFMRRDRSIAESNYTRVNMFSGGYLFAMVTVSLVQVLMIRSLFTGPSAHQMKMAT